MQSTKVPLFEIKENQKIIKANFHLNYGKNRIVQAKKNGMSFTSLGSITKNIYTGGIFKRVFVDDIKYGIPYISAQHMMSSFPLEIAKIISKKYTPRQQDMTLLENQILVSCAGTVGNVRLITKDLSGIIGSQDIIRIIEDNTKAPFGYIYAYLTSKTAYNYIQSFIYGSVVPRIDPLTLSKLPIPLISEKKQLEIHELIKISSKLRYEAHELLQNAILDIESEYDFKHIDKTFKVNIKSIKSGDKYTEEYRLESDFYQPSTKYLENQIRERKSYKLLGDISKSVNISNLRGRTFVEKGIVLFTGQSLGLLKPDLSKQMSRTLTRNIESNTTEDGDILITAFGTLGKTEFCYKNFYTGIFASQQIARIRVDTDKIDEGYLFLFLKSKIGQALIMKYKTGSVIEWANWNNFCSILVPIPQDKGKSYGDIARLVATKMETAYEIENNAKVHSKIQWIEKLKSFIKEDEDKLKNWKD